MNAISKPTTAGTTVQRDDWKRAMDLIGMVTERRVSIPILAHALIATSVAGMTVTATDLEMRLTVTIEDDNPYIILGTASVARLRNLVRRLPRGATVVMEVRDDRLCVACDGTTARFHSLAVEDFPHFAPATGAVDPATFAIGADVLRGMLDRTQRFVSRDGTRYYLNGVHLAIKGGELHATATDGHRLARITAAAPAGSEAMPGVIVPRKAVDVLRAMLAADKGADTVAAVVSASRVRFTVGNAVLDAKTIDGTFPDTDRVIPDAKVEPWRIVPRELRDAIRLAQATGGLRVAPARLDIDSADTMRVTMREAGGEDEVTATVRVNGPNSHVTIGFQARYLLDFMACIGGDALLHITSGADPTRIHDTADPRAVYVLMPMRLS